MDNRLEHALDISKRRKTFENQLSILKTKSQVHLSYSINGGKFTIDQSLISFVDYLVNTKKQDKIVLLDDRELPILVDNPALFLDEITSKYVSVSFDYYEQYNKLRKSTDIESMAKIHNIDH